MNKLKESIVKLESGNSVFEWVLTNVKNGTFAKLALGEVKIKDGSVVKRGFVD